jgi:acetylornithine deacetylase/succinyl-diaminopimelate desuccinylase-like protein
LIKIPSISTDSTYMSEMEKAAEWLANFLREISLNNVEIFPEPQTHPVVYGESLTAGPEAPTVLIYGHYDIQPVDPLEEWISPPFEATIRGEHLYARGATDMKGQVMASLIAVDAVQQTTGLPLNVKFLLEGQEEIGSRNLGDFIKSHQELLTCDVSLNPDAGMLGSDLPTITYALRGMADFELRFYGPKKDLHSGLYGGTVHNPAQAISEALAGLHDKNGKVTLPGFYDKVRPISEEERAELARLPRDDAYYLDQTGAPQLWGEPEFTPMERTGVRPTLEVNGVISGWTGEGMKTVLPAFAMAKLSSRLVPDQDPGEVHQQLETYLKENVPPTIRWELENFSGNPASISERDSLGIQAMSAALQTVWGQKPLFKREGGSIPVVGMVQRILGVESILTGFALPDNNVHSPNERIHLPTWDRGVQAFIHFIYNMGRQNS